MILFGIEIKFVGRGEWVKYVEKEVITAIKIYRETHKTIFGNYRSLRWCKDKVDKYRIKKGYLVMVK